MNRLTIKNALNSTLSFTLLLVAAGIAIPSMSLAESWELQTVDKEVPGTREIESGDAVNGIRISEKILKRVRPNEEVAVLNNLCIGYIMTEEFEKAEQFCKFAVETERETVVSRNNFGVLKAIAGRYSDAIEDFERAWEEGCIQNCENPSTTDLEHAHHVALRNLERTQQMMISQQGVAGQTDTLTVKE